MNNKEIMDYAEEAIIHTYNRFLLCLNTVTAFIFMMWKAKSILTLQPGLLYVRLVTMSKNTMML